MLIAVPVSAELFYQLQAIGSRTFHTFDVAVAAVIWYLVIGSVLMFVQSRLERRFTFSSTRRRRRVAAPGVPALSHDAR